MVQMNQFAEQKLRHRSREKTYRHQAGKAVGAGGCDVIEKKKEKHKRNEGNNSKDQ